MSVTYAGNSADAHLLAAARLLGPEPTGVAGEAFFITNDTPVLFWEFGRAIQRAAGFDVDPKKVRVVNSTVAYCIAWILDKIAWLTGTRPVLAPMMVKYLVMNRWYNISKAKERLEYRPQVDWEEGVRRGVKVIGCSHYILPGRRLLTHTACSGIWSNWPKAKPNRTLRAPPLSYRK
jgi:sterol-4alpha-carboxylate 3-dehydrogenase (decarboxylating)